MGFIESLQQHTWLGHIVWQAITSFVAFVFYGWGKRQAKHDGWRISESQLHTLALIGGWLGAWLGRNKFRHKTQKPIFGAVIYPSAAIHFVLLAWLVWLAI